jgi:TolB protein
LDQTEPVATLVLRFITDRFGRFIGRGKRLAVESCHLNGAAVNLLSMLRLLLAGCAALLALICPAAASDAARHLCFSRDDAIWLANLDGTGAHKVVTGVDPAISPDGARIAYTQLGKGTMRHIAVFDLASASKVVLGSMPSDNAYGPVWSPDEKYLLFKIFAGDHWRVALVGSDGAGFQFLGELSPANEDFQSPAWAIDGKSIYAQDLTYIYQLDLNGKVSKQWKIAEALSEADLNSNDRFDPAEDGKSLLLDADLNEEGHIKAWEGPPPAIFLFDINTGKSKRISPPKVYAWDPCWLNAEEYVFTCTTDGRHFGIYKLSLTGKEPQLLLKNASGATVSK